MTTTSHVSNEVIMAALRDFHSEAMSTIETLRLRVAELERQVISLEGARR